MTVCLSLRSVFESATDCYVYRALYFCKTCPFLISLVSLRFICGTAYNSPSAYFSAELYKCCSHLPCFSVHHFVNNMQLEPPKLKELAGRIVRLKMSKLPLMEVLPR